MDDDDRTQSLVARVGNPFASGPPATVSMSALTSVEQQRSIAEVQARMIIARANPRDPIRCVDMILRDCTRPTLANGALYQYARGGTAISGPSIRLAEALAQRWGNIASGIKELSRSNGYSECVAYAWDLESGYFDERQFQVKHWRDTKTGGYALTDERDIYELIANMGQRRKRAVLLTVIPGDVTEAAVDQCEKTLHATADTSPKALHKMAEAFAEFGVSKEQIEKRCQCRLEAIRPAQVLQLSKIHASLKDEMSTPDDWFDSGLKMEADKIREQMAAEIQASGSPQRTETAKQAAPAAEPRRRPGRPPKATETPHDPDTGEITEPPKPETNIPENIPPETVSETTIEIWPVDDIGEPLEDQHEPMDAVAFAKWFAAKLFLSKAPDALREHNADNLAEAGAVPAAMGIIQGALDRHNRGKTPPLDSLPPAIPAEPAKAARKPVAVPLTPKKAPHWPNYQAACQVEIDALVDDADADDWFRVNLPTFNGRASQIVVENRLNKRREAFVKASNDTLIRDNDQMSDDMILAEIKAEVAALNSTSEIRTWATGPIKAVMDGLSARNKAAHGLARDIVDQRWIEVDPPA
jgi:hypothetical protein